MKKTHPALERAKIKAEEKRLSLAVNELAGGLDQMEETVGVAGEILSMLRHIADARGEAIMKGQVKKVSPDLYGMIGRAKLQATELNVIVDDMAQLTGLDE